MNSLFVRALWGDEETRPRPPNEITPLEEQVARSAAWPHSVEPCRNYAFGWENHRLLASFDLHPILLSEHAVKNYTGATRRRTRQRGWFNYGASIWRQKLECLDAALTEADSAVWLDWDVRPVEPIPADFWEKMNSGPPIKAGISSYQKVQCGWRRCEPRYVHHGGFLYLRGRCLSRKLLAWSVKRPDLYDEPLYAMLIDELYGGEWLGPDSYRKDGFEPYCYNMAGKFQTFKPEKEVFRRYGS